MLQQTQVDRVIPFYKNFLQKFPTVKALAKAPLSEVLRAWQGLGYNRRAKLLHAAAKELQTVSFSSYRTKLIHTGALVRRLEELPGIGPYTARAVAAFAFNQDVIFIETNIRTAVTHHFFPKKKKVSDREIEKVLALLRQGYKGQAREWYSAIMDYGSFLKRSGVRLNAHSAHYTKPSKFTGSLREARGALLRTLASGATSHARLLALFGPSRRAQVLSALSSLRREGLIGVRGSRYTLPD
jgi:A/G-specific adenine glycosylase